MLEEQADSADVPAVVDKVLSHNKHIDSRQISRS
jgi:(2Fe-2S) ferredoxin